MKVGTDAVLLGAWANVKYCKTILEVGTGSGIIALMLAQRNETVHITAIDIHNKSIIEASNNFEKSLWKDQFTAKLISLQEFKNSSENKFDHIISNPPFFTNSTPAPNIDRHHARHTDTLLPHDFFSCCQKLLSLKGKISLILPFHDFGNWKDFALNYSFFPSQISNVFSYPGKGVERVLVEFSFERKDIISNDFYIRKAKGLGYSEEYLELTGEFYL